MLLERLRLTDFRNYAHLDLKLRAGLLIFQGRNAQGKSNLLEGIALLATSRSFRAGGERETVRWGAAGGFARVDAQLTRRSGPLSIEIVIADPHPPLPGVGRQNGTTPALPAPPAPRKRIKINGVPRRAVDLLGNAQVVLFAPPDLDLVAGAPQQRRHYLDVILCQVSHRYFQALAQFQKVQVQRSALLRRIREGEDDPRALTFWDEQFVTHAAPLMLERARMIRWVDEHVRRYYAQLSGGEEAAQVLYRPSFAGALAATTLEELCKGFREELTKLRKREISAGVNLLGPHRDDLVFLDQQQMDLGIYGSRGQQRSAALALKLAELDFLQAETGEQPILLLDDVFSELDEQRRGYLLEMVRALEQVIITTTDLHLLPADLVNGAACYRVEAGTIQQESHV